MIEFNRRHVYSRATIRGLNVLNYFSVYKTHILMHNGNLLITGL